MAYAGLAWPSRALYVVSCPLLSPSAPSWSRPQLQAACLEPLPLLIHQTSAAWTPWWPGLVPRPSIRGQARPPQARGGRETCLRKRSS